MENKPGAASSLAAEFVARAPKDGYTLFMASSANMTNPAINPNLLVRLRQGLRADRARPPSAAILVVAPSIGVNSVQELIALAKSKPGEVLYASTGVGTAPHLSGELFAQRAGVKLVHVPYQGSPQAATDLLAGRVTDDVLAGLGGDAARRSRQAQGAGVGRAASARRSLPNVPTMAEAGHARFRHQHLVRAGRAGGHAARNRRQARRARSPRRRNRTKSSRCCARRASRRSPAARTSLPRACKARSSAGTTSHRRQDLSVELGAPSRGPML